MAERIIIKKDGRFYAGYSLEIRQARGQGNTREEAMKDARRSIRLCKAYLKDLKN